ncbi:zinc finger and SCAN domain-containing protein 22-like [Gadus macrocephalus]|uniref:zinc finger and SCAN domain-containing protein 22-like n=1 Tax=Gadus macrocephalus TaxID=80720 RepID=UPI0028CB5538|nr:zinc finger and SCAN domain-containing protein 22-like [Gadus macrocephalus]
MSSPSHFSVQMSAIMDVLSKAAVAEITKLVEDESVVLRLEISQRDGEILELKRSLRQMEVDLFEAQESIAKAEASRCPEEINAFGAYGLQGRDKVEHDFSIPLGAEQNHIHEQMDPRVKIKSEPLDERDQPPLMNPVNTELAEIDKLAFDPEEDMVSPWPSSTVFEDVSVEQTHPTDPAQHGTTTHWNSAGAPKLCGASLMKEAPQVPPMCTGSTILPSNTSTEFPYLSGEGEGEGEVMQCRRLIQAGLLPADLQRWNSVGNFFGENAPSRKPSMAGKMARGWRANQKPPQSSHSHFLHRTQKPYKCQECGKSFTQRTRLNSHQSVHTGERPFSCQICGKLFSRQDNCVRHERFHSGIKPYRCETCGKCFTALSNVKIHQEIHRRGQ